jgi:hypothetical protein
MTEAAIVVAVEKGIISEDLKEKLMDYVRAGFTQASGTAEKRWARSNPFSEMVS